MGWEQVGDNIHSTTQGVVRGQTGWYWVTCFWHLAIIKAEKLSRVEFDQNLNGRSPESTRTLEQEMEEKLQKNLSISHHHQESILTWRRHFFYDSPWRSKSLLKLIPLITLPWHEYIFYLLLKLSKFMTVPFLWQQIPLCKDFLFSVPQLLPICFIGWFQILYY